MHLLERIKQSPIFGQRSKDQTRIETSLPVFAGNRINNEMFREGFGPPAKTTYKLLRDMLIDPTVFVCWKAAFAPIAESEWTFEATKDAPNDALEFIETELQHLKRRIMRNAAYALIYGWSPTEKVFNNEDGKITLLDLKHLLVDTTTIQVDQRTGNFAGYKCDIDSTPTKIPLQNCFHWNVGQEAGNLYGKARLESAVKDCKHAEVLRFRQAQWVTQTATPLMIIRYPPTGKEIDASGKTVTSAEAAMAIKRDFENGANILTVPSLIKSDAGIRNLIRSNQIDPAKFREWEFELLETNSDLGTSFVEMRKHTESLICRAFGLPEKTIVEGVSGSKSMTEAQQVVALQIADELNRDLSEQVQDTIIDHLLYLNYGDKAIGTVKLNVEPLHSEKRQLLLRAVEMFLAPQNSTLAEQYANVKNMLERAGIPVTDDFETEIKRRIIEHLETQGNPQPNGDNNGFDNNEQQGETGEPRTNESNP